MDIVRQSVNAFSRRAHQQSKNVIDVQPLPEDTASVAESDPVEVPAPPKEEPRHVTVLYSCVEDGLVASAVASFIRSVQVNATVLHIEDSDKAVEKAGESGAVKKDASEALGAPAGESVDRERLRKIVQSLSMCDAAVCVVSSVHEDYFEVMQFAIDSDVPLIPLVCQTEFEHAGLRLLLNQVQWSFFTRTAAADEFDTLLGALASRVVTMISMAVQKKRVAMSRPSLYQPSSGAENEQSHGGPRPTTKTRLTEIAQQEPKKIFISWAHCDREFVHHRLWRSLERAGFSCWIDVLQLAAGSRWRTEIASAVKDCEYFVFVVSPDSVRSRYCREEVEFAHAQAKKIIPIVFRDAAEAMETELSLRMLLSSFHSIDCTSDTVSGDNGLFAEGGDNNKGFNMLCEYLRGIRVAGVGASRKFVRVYLDTTTGAFPRLLPTDLKRGMSQMEYSRALQQINPVVNEWYSKETAEPPFHDACLFIIGTSLCCCMCICTSLGYMCVRRCCYDPFRASDIVELRTRTDETLKKNVQTLNKSFAHRGIEFRLAISDDKEIKSDEKEKIAAASLRYVLEIEASLR